MKKLSSISLGSSILIGAGVVALTALTLFLMGRIPWCDCGYIKLWHGVITSSENSQHISDWYVFSHIIHGLAFYWILSRIARKTSLGARGIVALLAEAAWEVFENTDLVINRYRTVTASLGYYGDSIINSTSDILAMVVGFVLARWLPVWASILIVVGLEVMVGYFIRDNLLLNIIMLIYPLDMIKTWQLGG